MKAFGCFSVLVLVIGLAFVCFVVFTKDCTFSNPGVTPTWHGNDITATIKNRKLKGRNYLSSLSSYPNPNKAHVPSPDEGNLGKVHLEDYRPIDPAPSSKAKIRPGPIQHGTPLMPYIPKPSPPPTPSEPITSLP